MAMADTKVSLDYWRKYFRSAKSDIFGLIDKAILVAAVDCPKEFKDRKDLIVEKLYNCQLSLNNGDDEYTEKKNDQIVGEVMRMKEVLSTNQLYDFDSDSILYEALRSLQMMQLSVEILNATKIGRTVSALRKHNSVQIRKLVQSLIDSWKLSVVENTITGSINKLNEPLMANPKPCNGLSDEVKRKEADQELSEMLKFENAKRRLHEGYQRIENAKKRRMIQIIEPIDLPKDSIEKRGSRKKLWKHSGN